ncbi:ThuA domain-containing protein [Flavobacterium sp. 7A]|uniref:ThuA domain-containing protein n=1 Tax=Flavobacterium sp. 7A TaxID=2940571 RepID=UPI002227E1FA|nr:ThuA domain-containing protein [Flavobacterium sp. 7A]MCW2120734.1 type 1 glutamine amidotransferase [Flavobacterium sp. 7A]
MFHIINKYVLVLLTISSFLIYSCKTANKTNASASKVTDSKSILIFSKTAGFRHTSIPKGIAALQKMDEEQGWKMQFSEDANLFTPETLSNFQMVLFLNTTGDILNSEQEKAFEKFINNGGSFVGVHAATDTEYEWPFYAEMIGAQFLSHPKQQKVVVNKNANNPHPATTHYPASFEMFDEWYNFKKPVGAHVNVLLSADENSYKGGTMGTSHPISWYHTYEGGRIFYTAMGHTDESYVDPNFLKHLQEGIRWALGETNVVIAQGGENLLEPTLAKWDVWMGAVHPSVDIDFEKSENVNTGKPMGLNNDPKKVFSIIQENGENILKVSGEIYGGLTTKNDYGDYHLTTQFKWGDKKWEPRLKDKKDSGILYHAKGPHGTFWKVWMHSLEYQVQDGDCGDFIALGQVYGDVPADEKVNANGKSNFIYNPKGKNTPIKYAPNYKSGRTTKSENYENPAGEWNTLEIYCLGTQSIHLVNGHVVNRVNNARYDVGGKTIPADKGKIQIQSEAAEVYYKNMRIEPITKFPSKLKNF